MGHGFISLKVKGATPSRLGVHSNNRFKIIRESKVVKEVVEKIVEKPIIVEKEVIIEKIVEKEVIVEKIVEKEPQMNMDQLAQVLLQQIGSMISPEAIAEAVAKQMPSVKNTQNPYIKGNMNTSSDEALTFIPSNIISNKAKASSESLANETKSEGSEGLSDALSALKALRKANKNE